MKTVVIILFILAVAYPGLRYIIYLISNQMAGTLGEVRKRQGSLLMPIVRGAATAGMADLMVVPSYPLGLLGGREPFRDGTPILLVHGLFHNSSAWLLMKKRLRDAGFQNVHTYQYNSFSGIYSEAVDGCQRRMDQLLQRSPTGKVILIGHSLGGLVIRGAVGNPRFWGKVAGMIALGTPHGGSDLAHLGGNRMARGLIPGHEIMATADNTPEADCPKLAIYNLVDDFVFPLETLYPPKSWEEIICSPMGHVWMLYSWEVTGLILDFLHKVEGEGKAG